MQDNKQENTQEKKPASKPSEVGQILVDEHIKIFDPNSDQVYLDKRESN